MTTRTSKSTKSTSAMSAAAHASNRVSAEERSRMIAEAAYFLAEQRAFQNGAPEQDWYEAEAQIEKMLQEATTH